MTPATDNQSTAQGDQSSSAPSELTSAEVKREQPREGSATGRRHRSSSRRTPKSGVRPTRVSAAWAAVVVAVLLGVALIDFIVENTRTERIDFFGVHGHVPVAVSLLAAALAGAVVVVAIGICRMTQLRLVVRRQRPARAAASDPSEGTSTV